jgi:hypothetical protein
VPATSDRRCLKVLPKWFDLKKYERAVALDAENWNFQIAVRSTCFYHLGAMRSPEPYLPPEWDAPILKALASLRSNPIAVANSPAFDHKVFSWCYETPVAAVRSMTRLDLYSIGRRVRERLTPTEIERTQKLLTQSPFALAVSPTDWLQPSVDEDCEGLLELPIMIDLRFPNRVLRQHFDIYLQRLRRRKGGRPKDARKKTPDLNKWGKTGVLPCIDLLLWGKS